MANPQVQFKIIAIDKPNGQLTVKFFNDDIPQGIVNSIDFEVQDGQVIVREGQALTDWIMGFCPMGLFVRTAALKTGTLPDMSAIEALVEPEPAPPAPEAAFPGEVAATPLVTTL